MTVAFVVGNGISRKSIDLSVLKKHGKIYGCNALYREFEPDVLIATDRAISQRIQESGYALKHSFYTRKPVAGSGATAIPEEIWGYSSGPVALNIAALDQYQIVYMLGFDMGPAETGLFNNVYADTEFYKTSESNPTYTGNWQNQILATFTKFSKTQFVRVQGQTTAPIAKFSGIQNLKHMAIQEFQELYK